MKKSSYLLYLVLLLLAALSFYLGWRYHSWVYTVAGFFLGIVFSFCLFEIAGRKQAAAAAARIDKIITDRAAMIDDIVNDENDEL